MPCQGCGQHFREGEHGASDTVDILASSNSSLVLLARLSAHRQSGRYNIGALKTFAAEPQISLLLKWKLLNYKFDAVAHGNADVAEFLRANGAAEVDGGRLSISPSAAGTEVPETFTNPSPRSAGDASAGAASL